MREHNLNQIPDTEVYNASSIDPIFNRVGNAIFTEEQTKNMASRIIDIENQISEAYKSFLVTPEV